MLTGKTDESRRARLPLCCPKAQMEQITLRSLVQNSSSGCLCSLHTAVESVGPAVYQCARTKSQAINTELVLHPQNILTYL